MKTFTTVAAAALLFASFVPGTAQADMREPVTVRVHHADLDLRRADHRAMLDARIQHAAMRACGAMTADLRRNTDIMQCRAEMRADALVKVAALSQAAPIALASNH